MTAVGKPSHLSGVGVDPNQIDVPPLPPELQIAADQATSQTSTQASSLANKQASKGNPKRQEAPAVDFSMLMGLQVQDPEKDETNCGYQLPKYWIEAVRILAFQLRVSQKEVAQALFYAGAMGGKPGGPLIAVPQSYIQELFKQCFQNALKQDVERR